MRARFQGSGALVFLTLAACTGQVWAQAPLFVSPEAQFTPKEVETKSERDKLMFRVKVQIPKELVGHYIDSIKTGVRGVAYVKTQDSAVFPQAVEANVITLKNVSSLSNGAPVAATAAAAK